MTTTHTPDTPTDPPPSRAGRAAVAIVVAGLLAMWGYVVYLAFFEGRADSPDKLDAPQFTERAEARCAAALDAISELPRAETQRDDPAGRADTVEQANEIYDDMLADLEALEVRGEGDDAELVDEWLTEWRVLLGDRVEFVERLRSDPDARLLVTAGPSGRQITLRIDEFATTNGMPSCGAPTDA